MTPPVQPDPTDPGFESTEMDRMDLRNQRHVHRIIETVMFCLGGLIGTAFGLAIVARIIGWVIGPCGKEEITLVQGIVVLGIVGFLCSPKIFARATAGQFWSRVGIGGKAS